VQTDARATHAEVISSDEFVGMIKSANTGKPKSEKERKLSKNEVDEWLKIFSDRKDRPK
jgi:hypothetical protein